MNWRVKEGRGESEQERKTEVDGWVEEWKELKNGKGQTDLFDLRSCLMSSEH